MHYFEEALSINRKFTIKERVKNNIEPIDRLNSILYTFKELINILKVYIHLLILFFIFKAF